MRAATGVTRRSMWEAMWLMLQQEEPDDYVIGTGEMHTVREFLELVLAEVGLDWRDYAETDPRYFRPAEVDALQANTVKAPGKLGWTPRVTFPELVRIMVQAEIDDLAQRSAGVVPQVTSRY